MAAGRRLDCPDNPATERVDFEALNSCGFGLGDMGLGGGTAEILVVGFAICSKWDRKEDTGF